MVGLKIASTLLFISLFLLALTICLLCLILSSVVGFFVPRARGHCVALIENLANVVNLVKRLLVYPLILTLLFVLVMYLLIVSDTNRVRSNIRQADKIVITSMGLPEIETEKEKEILYESEEREIIDGLAVMMDIDYFPLFSGNHTYYTFRFDFYKGNSLCCTYYFLERGSMFWGDNIWVCNYLVYDSKSKLYNFAEEQGFDKKQEELMQYESEVQD